MKTYLVTNTQKWGFRIYTEFSHPDYEHNILTTQAYKYGECVIRVHNAKEEEKLLNWPADEDFILDNWDWDLEECGDGDIDADSEMDYDVLEAIEEETEMGFWGLSDAGWDNVDSETVVENGAIEVTEIV